MSETITAVVVFVGLVWLLLVWVYRVPTRIARRSGRDNERSEG